MDVETKRCPAGHEYAVVPCSEGGPAASLYAEQCPACRPHLRVAETGRREWALDRGTYVTDGRELPAYRWN